MTGFEWADPEPPMETIVSHDEVLIAEHGTAGGWIAAPTAINVRDHQ